MATIGRIGIFRAQSAGGCVLVDHRVHAARRNAEEETGTSQTLEVAEVAVPVGLGHDGHTIACRLKDTPDDGNAKRRVVNVCIAREQDDVNTVVPSPQFQLFSRGRQEIRQPIFHNS